VSEFAPCPKCGSTSAKRSGYTWWGGLIGPRILNHVKCQQCGTTYNGKTGSADLTGGIVLYSVVVFVIVLALLGLCWGLVAILGAV